MLVGDEPWWRAQERSIRQAGARSMWVVSPEVDEAIPAPPDGPQERTVADADAPMFESVVAGARAVAHESPAGVFILPVDTPAPRRSTLDLLASGGPIATPRFRGKGGHPVWLSWNWVREQLLEGSPPTRRLDALIEPLARPVDVEDACVALNLNTPAEVASWLARRGSGEGNHPSSSAKRAL